MNKKNEENTVEMINKEYIKILYSKEYRLGKRIYKIKNSLKNMDFKNLINYLIAFKTQKKLNKISNGYSIEEIKYNTGNKKYNNYAVYTCITNNYDKIFEPYFLNTDYFLFTDNLILDENSIWKKKNIPDKIKKFKGNKINRYCKMHPFELLDGYDFSIYIDGNVQVVSDISGLCDIAKESKCGIAMHQHPNRNCTNIEAKACEICHRGNIEKIHKQMMKYRKEKFPEKFGFCEATIIVCDLKNPVAKKIMSDWYDEFCKSESERDQLALPYVIWKNGYNMSDIGNLGNNLLFNPLFRINNLGEHKVLR